MQRAYAGPNSGIETAFESGVDQVIRKSFSEFQHATMWQHLSSLV
jgi:hypothetical protein